MPFMDKLSLGRPRYSFEPTNEFDMEPIQRSILPFFTGKISTNSNVIVLIFLKLMAKVIDWLLKNGIAVESIIRSKLIVTETTPAHRHRCRIDVAGYSKPSWIYIFRRDS